MRIKNRAEYTLDLLTENALAYRSSYERISTNIRQFRDDLATALRPYIGVNGSLEGVVGSAALIFKKT